ncbi:hypothetical protein Ciccas_008777 [Cichlidogyrus casuarinus]|uniref:Uncharacterized protein n=1 Tax=Cichlidogyrus casuarinus TaxID=1844966 RepID=A0ABD2PZW1_9PLAT
MAIGEAEGDDITGPETAVEIAFSTSFRGIGERIMVSLFTGTTAKVLPIELEGLVTKPWWKASREVRKPTFWICGSACWFT